MEFYTIGGIWLYRTIFLYKAKRKWNRYIFAIFDNEEELEVKKYAYVNSTYLQNKLKEYGIKYLYISQLSPTTEIRELQKEIDKKNGISKSARIEIGKVFEIEYKNKILSQFNLIH